jgi:DNA polymerase III sliding clamp (beta) subunit (PCNA family)
MVKIKMDSKIAKTMLKAAAAASDEVLFNFGKDGVEVRQMDPAMISMVAFTIPKAKFMEYSVEGEGEALMVEVNDLLRAVSRAPEVVGIERVDNKLCVKSIWLGQTTTLFVSLIEPGSSTLSRMPELKPEVKVVMKTKDLKKAVEDVQSLAHAEQIAFTVLEGNLRVSGLGDKNEMVLDFTKDVSIDGTLPDKVLYNAKYIIDLLGAIDSDKIRLEMKLNTPLIMRDMEMDIQTLLAPHMKREED